MSKKYTPSDAELEILQVLWEKEPISVRGIHEDLAKKKEVGYTTTLKQVQRLFEKGILGRVANGKSHLYTSHYKEKDVKAGLLDKLKDAAFKGSAMDLVMHALGESEPTMDDLDLLEQFLKEHKSNKK